MSTTPTSTLQTAGIHHITAIAADAQRNHDFYTRTLALRLVKQTVNFDDPGTYHLYFGDHPGSPGTILTFFPWPHVKRGVRGTGSVDATAFLIPTETLGFWADRLASLGVPTTRATRLGSPILAFEDPDGLRLELIEDLSAGTILARDAQGVPARAAIRGFHGATLLVRDAAGPDRLLTAGLGMERAATEGPRTRYRAVGTGSGPVGAFVDVVQDPAAPFHKLGGGIVHHLAMRAASDHQQADFADHLAKLGLRATPVAERFYFRSIYFREPQGVLFEIATDAPGFAADEPLDALGTSLKLPPMYEKRRSEIERVLPPLKV
jgi:glyoxalase family protein